MRRIIVFFLGVLFSLNSLATEFFYRVDSRPPEQIFVEGFQSRGENKNYAQHLSGHSCTDSRNSFFVATTSSLESAYRIAEAYNNPVSNGNLYLYSIRADENFYPARVSANFISRNNPDLFSPVQWWMINNQNEYSVPRLIPSSNIASATRLVRSRVTGYYENADTSSNINYLDINTSPNSSVIPGIADETSAVSQHFLSFGRFLSSCISFKGVGNDDHNLNRSLKDSTSYFHVNFYKPEPALYRMTAR